MEILAVWLIGGPLLFCAWAGVYLLLMDRRTFEPWEEEVGIIVLLVAGPVLWALFALLWALSAWPRLVDPACRRRR